MISKAELKRILVSNQKDIEGYMVIPRALPEDDFSRRIFVGLRRAGKSFMLFQKIQSLLQEGHDWGEMLYLNFEDDRLGGFTSEDFELILECHAELYPTRPMLFLDEIQNIEGWEKFARRLADTKYSVWITGSNAKMLSSEIMSSLGGRYLATEVYPYSFVEYLNAMNIPCDEHALLGNDSRGTIMRALHEYFHWGGLPESVGLSVKRSYISSVFQKIYLGDICARNKVASPALLRLMLKKLAENVCQRVSYSRIANILSSVGGKVSMPTIAKYIEQAEASWLLMRLRNVSAPLSEKESVCKYYFIDNGVLNLFLMDGDSALMENLVAISLFRKYGHDPDNERIFFYNDRVEVDFYVPEDKLAIQVSCSISQSPDTYDREIGALKRLPKVLPCARRIVLTYEETDTITDEFGTIEVLPLSQWLLN